MVLVDTSVWVAHLRHGNIGLEMLLNNGHVVCHPFIIGELACGNLKRRSEILSLIQALPESILADHKEGMQLIESQHIMGRGLGYVDMHLLASALLTEVQLWTLDRRLKDVSSKLRLEYSSL